MVHEKLVQPLYADSVHLNPLSQAKETPVKASACRVGGISTAPGNTKGHG